MSEKPKPDDTELRAAIERGGMSVNAPHLGGFCSLLQDDLRLILAAAERSMNDGGSVNVALHVASNDARSTPEATAPQPPPSEALAQSEARAERLEKALLRISSATVDDALKTAVAREALAADPPKPEKEAG